ncbi:MAG: DUF3626 domain-containing protein [Deltaproteobacteria bacterium]|nr:DUF3626 domain-containing protein [Deltaproteobacteria bacterium]MBK8713253.1 DUF3626 domain-containing protein [Deltaproteobacteria bacterium]
MPLSPALRSAIEHVAAQGGARRAEAVAQQDHIRRMCDISADDLRDALLSITQNARVALHFHPDRPDATGRTVAQALLRDGVYRSQFETGLSNGGLSAHPGGSRDRCEQSLFGRAYHASDTTNAERPKYGALSLLHHADGPSPRFGSCYFVLAAAVGRRCTFTYLDSHEGAVERGTLEEFDDVFAAVLRSAFYHGIGLGESDLTVPGLVHRLRCDLSAPLCDLAHLPIARNLNHYVEAQVHGDVVLHQDVDALVADPSFRESETGRNLTDLCRRNDVALHWDPGFLLTSDKVLRDFRGPTMPSLAERIARAGTIDASTIGAAVTDLRANPGKWSDRGSPDDVLQELELLWHVLLKYGTQPAEELHQKK